MEPTLSNESMGEETVKGLDQRCCIAVHSKRKRLADPDGVSAKALIDGIVAAGILPDDSAGFIQEVRFSQEKVGSTEAEETTIQLFVEE